ncbi:hypothetical protein BGZ98_002718 [Dissophora globulifera]|nr:hypothetical protein BGZ98_002718 [Dissophora globulifera]
MRLTSLCLGLGAFLSLAVTVLAQEIIAPEEWFESLKLSQQLVTRKLHQNKRIRGQHRVKNPSQTGSKLSKRSIPPPSSPSSLSSTGSETPSISSSSTSLKLQARSIEFPLSSEIESRAREFESYRADAISSAPSDSYIAKKMSVNAGSEAAMEDKRLAPRRVKKAAKKAKKQAKKLATRKQG